MNLLNIKRRIYIFKHKYTIDTLMFCHIISFIIILFTIFPFFKFLLRIPDQSDQYGRYKVLSFHNNNGENFYVTGLYTGGWKTVLDNYVDKDTFTVEKKAIEFMEEQNKLIEVEIKKREDAEFRLVHIEP
jgi:hypothetical protein